MICGAIGGYGCHELGAFYDDTSDWMDIHTHAYMRLPQWSHKYLNAETLGRCWGLTERLPLSWSIEPFVLRTDSELRPERVVAFQKKFAQLAEAEEKEFLAEREARRLQ